jgi:glyceraldehyde-3-phosphate dehydrogenase/erythrose-4-phosphate dehydrogenase
MPAASRMVQSGCSWCAAGLAVRVPLTNSSLTDAVFEVERATTAEEVNALLSEAADGALKGILRVRPALRPLHA